MCATFRCMDVFNSMTEQSEWVYLAMEPKVDKCAREDSTRTTNNGVNEKNTSTTAEHTKDVRTPEELVAEEVLSSCFDQRMGETEGVKIAYPDSWYEVDMDQIDQKVRKPKVEFAEQQVGQPEQGRKETRLTRAIHTWARCVQQEGECMRALRSLQGNSAEDKRKDVNHI